jgi:hypothetical protein
MFTFIEVSESDTRAEEKFMRLSASVVHANIYGRAAS